MPPTRRRGESDIEHPVARSYAIPGQSMSRYDTASSVCAESSVQIAQLAGPSGSSHEFESVVDRVEISRERAHWSPRPLESQ